MKYMAKGFTLIEILISLGIIAMISTIALNVFSESLATYNRANFMLELQSNGNQSLSLLEDRLRSADRLVLYEDSGGCVADCASSWVYLYAKNPTPSRFCTLVGWEHDLGGNPDIWYTNGYIFLQDGNEARCQAAEMAGEIDGSPSPIFGATNEITNRNASDPYNGVNVSNLSFMIDNTSGDDPATIGITLELRQGVSGNLDDPPVNRKARLNLESTVSLR